VVVVIRGCANSIYYYSQLSSIVGGCCNCINYYSCYSSIVGGVKNCIRLSGRSVILGGNNLCLDTENDIVLASKLRVATFSQCCDSRILTADSCGNINYRDVSTIGGVTGPQGPQGPAGGGSYILVNACIAITGENNCIYDSGPICSCNVAIIGAKDNIICSSCESTIIGGRKNYIDGTTCCASYGNNIIGSGNSLLYLTQYSNILSSKCSRICKCSYNSTVLSSFCSELSSCTYNSSILAGFNNCIYLSCSSIVTGDNACICKSLSSSILSGSSNIICESI